MFGSVHRYIVYTFPRIDRDALLYVQRVLSAGGSMSPGQITAIDTFVKAGKQKGWWGQMDEIYPIMGGNSGAHAVKLKWTANDTLTWVNSPSHTSSGVQGNGTTQYGNSNFNPATNGVKFVLNNGAIFVYSRTDSASNEIDMGNVGGGVGSWVRPRTGINSMDAKVNSLAIPSIANSDSRGFFHIKRTDGTNQTLGRNGTETTVAGASNSVTSLNIYLLAVNNTGAAGFFSARQCCFFAIGAGSGYLMTDYYNDVLTLQTVLNRN